QSERRRRLSDQRKRQQQRGVALCPTRGIWQQPPWSPIFVQRRIRRTARQLRVGCATVLVREPADGEALVQRCADSRVVRGSAEDSWRDQERPDALSRLSADGRS